MFIIFITLGVRFMLYHIIFQFKLISKVLQLLYENSVHIFLYDNGVWYGACGNY